MGRTIIETIMGAVVLIVAAGFLFFAYDKSGVKTVDGYRVTALFDDVSGIGVGTEVRVGGIKVGVVDGLQLDTDSYRATLFMQIKDVVKLPKDSSAAIASSGLLGDKFVKLDPGGSDDMLHDGGVISFTQSSISFEELLGKFVFSGGGVEDETVDADPILSSENDNANPFSLDLE